MHASKTLLILSYKKKNPIDFDSGIRGVPYGIGTIQQCYRTHDHPSFSSYPLHIHRPMNHNLSDLYIKYQ